MGQTSNFKERWNQHLKCANLKRPKFYQLLHKAINKYGCKNFEILVLEICKTEQEAVEKEIFWIDFYKSNVKKYGNDFGYNLTDGGEGSVGYHHTTAAKKKISELQKGKILSEDTKIKMKISQTGKHLGSSNNRAKLSENDVIEIKKLLVAGIKPRDIVLKYNVQERAIRNIRAGRTWSHI